MHARAKETVGPPQDETEKERDRNKANHKRGRMAKGIIAHTTFSMAVSVRVRGKGLYYILPCKRHTPHRSTKKEKKGMPSSTLMVRKRERERQRERERERD